ncbi:tRNA pseudouridine(55) synthase TruB [Pseudolysinimonas kribbensis]|uniref:tRNA pseudouridine synthase B n=1 Tax=Pseudolysinimonas kribbensis TaxID=433641 RepID=A0ABQ6KDN4_9MICO|nr:tRNA pseudouridine(55) synthase TruB [Pseudolysinimonas kribbensis]GMA96617.1 tRNA pseudouridine synthase B [Pseudolysinimonas kribbensis]
MTDAAPTGILLVDKPGGVTSHDVVGAARRALGTRKVGHAGTLDPMATGLLILGVGTATRLLTYLVGLDKTYAATIRLGESTTTDDAEGETVTRSDASGLDRAAIDAGISALTGELDQVPSTVSAIKVDGRRAYARVRDGEDVQLAPRRVTVSRFDVLAERRGDGVVDLDVIVDCSSGTYIRALARDLGAGLGVGGHLTALRRTAIGPFPIPDAVPVDAIGPSALRTPASIATALYPALELDDEQAAALADGKRIPATAPDAPVVAALHRGRLTGLVAVADGVARVVVNFPPAPAGSVGP